MAQFPRVVDVEVHANWAVVKPGDTLVVAVNLDRLLTEQEAEAAKTRLEAELPGVKVVVVVANSLAVYKPEK